MENNNMENNNIGNNNLENNNVISTQEVNEIVESTPVVNDNVENITLENIQEKNENIDNKKLFNIIGVALALLIIGISGFLIYKSFIEISNNTSNNNNNNENSESNNKEIKESDINKVGFEQYNILYSKNSYLNNTYIFFKDESVNLNNLSNQDKLYLLYSFVSTEDKNKTGTYSEDCFLSKGIYTKDTYPDNCPKETFDKSILTEQINKHFGNDFKVDYTDFYASSSYQCFIKESKYTCLLNASDFKIMDYTTFMKYDSAKLENNILEITSYLLTARKYPVSNYTKGIYSNASATNKIDDLPFEISNTITQELNDRLIEQYKDKITKYKSTFTKVRDNYLWEKTEIVK